jgi:hypothetical protein
MIGTTKKRRQRGGMRVARHAIPPYGGFSVPPPQPPGAKTFFGYFFSKK